MCDRMLSNKVMNDWCCRRKKDIRLIFNSVSGESKEEVRQYAFEAYLEE